MSPGVSNCADCAEMMPTYCHKLSVVLFSTKVICLLRDKRQQIEKVLGDLSNENAKKMRGFAAFFNLISLNELSFII